MPTQTTGSFTFTDWTEEVLGEGYPKLAHASVTNAFSGGIEASGTVCRYTIAYVEEGLGTFTGMEALNGTLDGRKGAFLLEQRGSFRADGSLECAFDVVPGSGPGELAGLRGSGGFTTRHGDTSVAYTFAYELG